MARIDRLTESETPPEADAPPGEDAGEDGLGTVVTSRAGGGMTRPTRLVCVGLASTSGAETKTRHHPRPGQAESRTVEPLVRPGRREGGPLLAGAEGLDIGEKREEVGVVADLLLRFRWCAASARGREPRRANPRSRAPR